MSRIQQLRRWLDAELLNSVRKRMTFGLLPGLLALLTLLGVSLLANDILVQSNKHLAEAGWELATTRSLQLNLQQALIPFDAGLSANRSGDEYVNFVALADRLDAMFIEAETQYGEADERVFFNRALAGWQMIHSQADEVLGASPEALTPTEANVLQAELMAAANEVWNDLEQLNDVVFHEMQETVAASHRAHDTASALLIGSTLIAFALGVLFLILFANYITRPLTALQEGAQRIGAGELDARLDIEQKDEIGALALEFNRMAGQLQDSYQHLEDRVNERTAQLWALNKASQSVVGELQLDRVLQTIGDLARTLGDAEFAAVLIPRLKNNASPRFIISQDLLEDAIPDLPSPIGRGMLGLLLKSERPVRSADLQQHPAAAGFPSGHPFMKSFLGLPIRMHGRTIGGLYLTNKHSAASFTQEDEEMLTMLAAYAGIAIENARLYEELTLMNEELEQRVQERTAELEAVSAERAEYAASLRQVLNRNVQIQEEEQRRIAKGIHDGVSQWLMGALFELQAARVRLPDDLVDVQRHLKEAQRVLKEVKEEMRRVIYDLHPPLLESNGLVTAMRNHIQELEAHSDLEVDFVVEGESMRLPPQQELALFRIGQEALTNVLKHADSDVASVRLGFDEDCVCLCVTDYGQGFTPGDEHADGPAQLGLLSMRERAAAAGAQLDIRSAPDSGATVQVRVPYDADTAPSHPKEALVYA